MADRNARIREIITHKYPQANQEYLTDLVIVCRYHLLTHQRAGLPFCYEDWVVQTRIELPECRFEDPILEMAWDVANQLFLERLWREWIDGLEKEMNR